MAEGRKKQTNTKRVNQNEIVSADESINRICIPVSERDFKIVLYFGYKYDWFRAIANKIEYTNGCLCFGDLTKENVQIIEKKIYELIQSVICMSSDSIMIPRSDSSVDLKKKINDIELEKPNVCVIINDKDIEVISANYMDILEAKALIQRIWKRRVNRKAGRTFSKLEESNDS